MIRSGDPMTVTVHYFGGSRDQAGCRHETLHVEAATTIADIGARVTAAHPGLAPLLATARWARNFEFAAGSEVVHDGDEIALLPPVSGGAPLAELTDKPIDPAAVLRRVGAAEHGATVLFVGTVRSHARGRNVDHLEYEAYGPMASRQLERIAQHCEALCPPGTAVAIAHRTGRLDVGDVSVVIAAASAHRDEAFRACREAIEQIKQDVPIWKQEFTADGATWVGWGGG